MPDSDGDLRKLVDAIVSSDSTETIRLLEASPQLAVASFESGATRQTAKPCFLDQIGRYIYAGDTALHIAAAAYQPETVRKLIAAGANAHAKNRRGDEPLHSAAVGHPGSPRWNPAAQTVTIAVLIDSGADPNAVTKDGVTPLHRAVRTRCAAAVRILLERGADPKRKNGSTPLILAAHNTGRGGTGLAEAKSEQQEIVRLLTTRKSPI